MSESEKSVAALADLQKCQQEQEVLLLETAQRSQKASGVAVHDQSEARAALQSALNRAEARALESVSASKACQDRLGRAERIEREAASASEEAVQRCEVHLVASIPCPVCRSALRLQDFPFAGLEFAQYARAEAALAPGRFDEAKEASCRECLSPELLEIVQATQQLQRKLILARRGNT